MVSSYPILHSKLDLAIKETKKIANRSKLEEAGINISSIHFIPNSKMGGQMNLIKFLQKGGQSCSYGPGVTNCIDIEQLKLCIYILK